MPEKIQLWMEKICGLALYGRGVHLKVTDVNCDELHLTECLSLLNQYLKQNLLLKIPPIIYVNGSKLWYVCVMLSVL